MYNEERKLRFLEASGYSDTTRNSVTACFNLVARVEKSEDMDLSDFNQKQIIDMLKSLDSKSRNFLLGMCSYFSKYYSWCFDQGLVENVVNEYAGGWIKPIVDSIIPIEFMIKKYYSREELMGYLDKIYAPSNKFFTYGLYLGITLEEILNLKIQDLDENNKTIKLITGRKIKVDDLLITLMKKTNSEDYYYALPQSGQYRDGYCKYLESSSYVLKQLARKGEDAPLNKNVYGARLEVIKEQAGNKFITAVTLYKNGLIDYILRKHREDDPTLDLNTILNKEIDGKMYEYDVKTLEFIKEFGSNANPAKLRYELKDYISYFK